MKIQLRSLIAMTLTALVASRAHAVQIKITNENREPVANASVLVGTSINNPFANNQLTSDSSGMVIIPEKWGTNLPITVTAAGYLKSTYLDILPTNTVIQINREDTHQALELKGDAVNFGDLKKDGKIDFALVYPAFKYAQFSRFDVSSVLNSDVDILQVITEEIAIPSNVSLPVQTENYILPINFDKPTYRMNFKQPGDYRMMAAKGQFPFKQVVSDLRDGKSFFDVMKYFRFTSGGQKDVALTSSMTGVDVPVDQIQFDKTVKVAAPTTLPTDTLLLSFSVVNDGDYYFATDLKQLEPSQTADLVLPAKYPNNFLVSLLLSKSEANKFHNSGRNIHILRSNRYQLRQNTPSSVGTQSLDPLDTTYFLLDLFARRFDFKTKQSSAAATVSGLSLAQHEKGNPTPLLLNLVPRPTVNGLTLSSTQPTAVAGVEPVSTRFVLSEVERFARGKKTIEVAYRVWEVTQVGWTNQLTAPDAFGQLDPKKHYKWEVFYTGRMTNSKKEGEYFLNDVTHVSRNSIPLQ